MENERVLTKLFNDSTANCAAPKSHPTAVESLSLEMELSLIGI